MATAQAGTRYGSGQYTYEFQHGWGRLPDGWSYKEAAAVGTDSQDNVYVFSRGEHPVIVFDREGNFLRSWGEGVFKRPHGVHMGPDDCIYLTDDGDHSVRKCTLDGKVLLTLGVPGRPAPHMSGLPFHRCTHTALSPRGDIYVSDGYGNARVHKYSPDGKLLLSWGEPGTDPGQFNVSHNVCCDADGWVYVADRENHRVQVFDGNGKYETQWNNLHRPCGMYVAPGRCPVCYIAETGPGMDVNKNTPNLGARVSIVTHEGKLLARVGERTPGFGMGQFAAPHGICVDSRGDIYVAEVSFTAWPRFSSDPPPAGGPRSLQKLKRVVADG
jgi:DNA-binding beta-propeller fold protein YncE